MNNSNKQTNKQTQVKSNSTTKSNSYYYPCSHARVVCLNKYCG